MKMTVKVFYTNNKKLKEIESYFQDNNIEYTMQNLNKEELTWDQFLSMIEMAEDGIESLMVKKGKNAKKAAEALDLDSITLRQFHEMCVDNPLILRSLIVKSKNNMMVGFNQDELCLFDNRSAKKARFSALLETVRLKEKYELEEELGYAI